MQLIEGVKIVRNTNLKKMPKVLLTTIALCVHLILYLQCAYI